MFKNLRFMQESIVYANLGLLYGEIPIGCTIVNNSDKKHFSSSNMVYTKKDVTAHAEILCLQNFQNTYNSTRLDNCDMYVTLEPCYMCFYAICAARIKNLYIGCCDNALGAVYTNVIKTYYYPKIIIGIKESECYNLINDFFSLKRL